MSEIIKKQIETMMTSSKGYFPQPSEIFQVDTDINVWPYNRQFRGSPSSTEPIIWEREAGFRQILPQSAVPSVVGFPEQPGGRLCFQAPCSTIFPCRKPYQVFQGNKEHCVYTSP